jgi:hypothetical protein
MLLGVDSADEILEVIRRTKAKVEDGGENGQKEEEMTKTSSENKKEQGIEPKMEIGPIDGGNGQMRAKGVYGKTLGGSKIFHSLFFQCLHLKDA